MPSTFTSKSFPRKKKKSKFVRKHKPSCRVRKSTRNWLELPSDIMLNILQRLSVADRLENAQKVCTAWREICKDPVMWRVIFMNNFSGQSESVCHEMCKRAVDRSQGQLVQLSIVAICNHELLQYVADRSSQLRRLEIIVCSGEMCGFWSEALKKFLLLEELSFVGTYILQEDIEAAGRCCPMLKTLKVNHKPFRLLDGSEDNEIALAIGKSLPELTHLELIRNSMKNLGLQTILDGCCHLESLDLRGCVYLDLNGNLGKRCYRQIKHLKLPHDSL